MDEFGSGSRSKNLILIWYSKRGQQVSENYINNFFEKNGPF